MAKQERRPRRLEESGLFRLRTMGALARLLHWKKSPSALRSLCLRRDNWDEFDQARPGKKPRRIQAPKPAIKVLQRRLNDLLQRIEAPEYLHSGTVGRSYLTNSALHRDAEGATVTVDISDFYPSVTRKRLFVLFRTVFQCSSDVADALAGLLSCGGSLATGSPASALVAFWAAKDMFDGIAERAKRLGGRFSLYVDDITLTARTAGRGDVSFIERHVGRYGFRLARKKSRVYRAGQPREITGRVLRNGQSRAPNKQHRYMHEALSAMGPDAPPAEVRSAIGRIQHVAILDEIRSQELMAGARRLRGKLASS